MTNDSQVWQDIPRTSQHKTLEHPQYYDIYKQYQIKKYIYTILTIFCMRTHYPNIASFHNNEKSDVLSIKEFQ